MAGKAFGISGFQVARGRKLLAKGVPELIALVDSTGISLNRAEEVSRLPRSEQNAAVAGGTTALRSASRKVRGFDDATAIIEWRTKSITRSQYNILLGSINILHKLLKSQTLQVSIYDARKEVKLLRELVSRIGS